MNTKKSQSEGKTIPKELWMIVLIHLVIALPIAYYLNIWADEASTLYSTQDGILGSVANSINEKQAPFYFVLIGAWRLFSESFFFARIFSIICTAFAVVFFFLVARKFWDKNTSLFATFFFAIHPYLFWAATEIRVYSLIILLSLVLFFLFEKCFLRDSKPGFANYFGFVLCCVIALYSSFYLGFQLATMFFILIALRRLESIKKYFLCMLATGLIFLPMVYGITTRVEESIDGTEFPQSLGEGLRQIWNHALTFALPTEFYPPEEQTYISFVRVWLIRIAAVVSVCFLFLKRKAIDQTLLVFGVLSFGISGFLLIAYFAVGTLYIEIRHASVLFAPLLLFLTALIVFVVNQIERKRLAVGLISVILIVSYSYAFTAVLPEGVKRGDWARVARFVEENEKPNQPVVVFRTYEVLAFRLNYNGDNRIVPDSRYFYWNYEGEIGSQKTWPKQIDWVISEIPEGHDELWLVTEELCHTSEACLPLENFIKANYTVVKQKDFYKERVRLLRKR